MMCVCARMRRQNLFLPRMNMFFMDTVDYYVRHCALFKAHFYSQAWIAFQDAQAPCFPVTQVFPRVAAVRLQPERWTNRVADLSGRCGVNVDGRSNSTTLSHAGHGEVCISGIGFVPPRRPTYPRYRTALHRVQLQRLVARSDFCSSTRAGHSPPSLLACISAGACIFVVSMDEDTAVSAFRCARVDSVSEKRDADDCYVRANAVMCHKGPVIAHPRRDRMVWRRFSM